MLILRVELNVDFIEGSNYDGLAFPNSFLALDWNVEFFKGERDLEQLLVWFLHRFFYKLHEWFERILTCWHCHTMETFTILLNHLEEILSVVIDFIDSQFLVEQNHVWWFRRVCQHHSILWISNRMFVEIDGKLRKDLASVGERSRQSEVRITVGLLLVHKVFRRIELPAHWYN